jgi:uroporphyrinogen-III decarboxylase
MEKSAQELYRERQKRVADAIQMKVPDRVPIEMAFSYFPAKYAGITCEDAYYEYDAWLAACKKTLLDFDTDVPSVQGFFPGKVLELIAPRSLAWPGHGTSALHSHQAIEGEFMKADEYAAFMGDNTDFMLRSYLPRISAAAEPFSLMPSLASCMGGYMTTLALAQGLSTPEIASAIERLQKAGNELRKWAPKIAEFGEEIRRIGFPPLVGHMALAPFDAISDNLRGMRGSMLDMYRQPDRVMDACEYILKKTLERIPQAEEGAVNAVGIPLHRGSEGFMSLKQFVTIYWPGLRSLIKGLVDKGQTPVVFFEGDYTSRLEYLLEVPKGKIFAHFDTTDVYRAHDVLKGHMCLSGNLACSILQTGTVDDVKAHVKKMIDIMGKDGGFIMSTRSPVDDVKPENLKAMIDFTHSYGVYR